MPDHTWLLGRDWAKASFPFLATVTRMGVASKSEEDAWTTLPVMLQGGFRSDALGVRKGERGGGTSK